MCIRDSISIREREADRSRQQDRNPDANLYRSPDMDLYRKLYKMHYRVSDSKRKRECCREQCKSQDT